MRKLHCIYVLLGLLLQSCWYSFTGVSIPNELKTLKIENFTNTSELVVPAFSQIFSQKLRDKFLSQSSLKQIDGQADLIIKGNITGYQIMPIALQGNDRAAQNRLTVSIEFQLISNKFEEFNKVYNVSNFVDFTTAYSSAENQLIQEISEKLSQDIFNKTFSNW
jgi:outer membrane lipopolysaccharide assembly protein LptE/RlpB